MSTIQAKKVSRHGTARPTVDKGSLTVRTPAKQGSAHGAQNAAQSVRTPVTEKGVPTEHTPGVIPPMPSVLDIGRWVMVLDKTHDALEQELIALRKAKSLETLGRDQELGFAISLAEHRGQALRDLALSLPPRTVGDVAVQLAYAWHEIDSLQASELDEQHAQSTLLQIRRVLLGGMPVALAAAGVALEDVTFASDERFSRIEFPDLGDGA